MSGKHGRRLLAGAGTLTLCVLVAVVAIGLADPTEAASVPKVLIMRCSALGDPNFSYQVTALSRTPQLVLSIEASDVEGQGDDCAEAIAKMAAAGIDLSKVKLHATDEALVVTVAY